MAQTKIRVLRILHNLGGGGVQQRLLSLIPYISDDFSVSLVSFTSGRLEKDFSRVVEDLKIIPRRSKFDPLCLRELVKYMREKSFHLVHTHTHKPNTTGRIAALIAQVPVIIAQEHNVDEWKGKFQRWLDRKLAQFTDRVVVVSQKVGEFYSSIGIPSRKITVIYNGVELERFTPQFDEKKGDTIGFVGRIHPQKGIEDMVEVGERVVEKFPRVKFLILGEGPLEGYLRKEVERRGIKGNFLFMGYMRNMNSFYEKIDILFLPSLREGFPNAILEGMASGLPIVATDVGGIKEVVREGVDGFLARPGDVDRMSECLLKLLKDEILRRKMGLSGRKRVEKFSIQRMAEETKSLYYSLLKEKGCL